MTLGLYAWNTQVNQMPELRGLRDRRRRCCRSCPLVVAFLLLQRFWRSGLGTGAVK